MQNAIETAAQQIRDCAAREIQLLAEEEQKRAAATEAETLAGRDYLDARDTGALDRALKLAAEARMVGLALKAIREQRHDLVEAHHRAIIGDLHQRSAEAQRQAAEIRAKTAPLIESLKQIEGVDYIPHLGVPESDRLLGLVGSLENRAAELQTRGPDNHGSLQLDGRFTLPQIAQSLAEIPVHGPDAITTINWLRGQKHAQMFENNDTSIRISWDATGILPQSYVKLLPAPLAVVRPEPETAGGPRKLSPSAYLQAESGREHRPAPAEKTV